MIQQTFQQYASLREEECVMKFFNTLAGFANIDQETYRCELIVITCSPHSVSDRTRGPFGDSVGSCSYSGNHVGPCVSASSSGAWWRGQGLGRDRV